MNTDRDSLRAFGAPGSSSAFIWVHLRLQTKRESKMATGKIVRFEAQGPAGTGLVRLPDFAPGTLVAGTPVQRGHTYFEDKTIGLSAGVWDCTAMTGKLEPYSVNEFMLVLEGAVTIVDARDRAVRPSASRATS
jgi:uncharacterized cupin superfamily protein